MKETITYYENYSPVGDISVLAICFVFIILIRATYINRTKNFMLFQAMIALVMISAVSSVSFHVSMNMIERFPHELIYTFRMMHHITMFANLLIYVYYVMEPLHLDRVSDKRFVIIAGIGFVGAVAYEILGTVLKIGFYLREDGSIHEGKVVLPFEFLFFVGLIAFLLIHYRNRLYNQIMKAIIGTWGISVLVLGVQGRHHQTSFTTLSFIFPILALFYLIHSNPYDIEIGAVNESSFEETVRYAYRKKQPLLFMSLYLPLLEKKGKKYPKEIQGVIRHFSEQYFKGAVLFQISSGHMILVVDTHKNKGYEDKVKKMLEHFVQEYPKYYLDYKIIIIQAVDEISKDNDYIRLIKYVGKSMEDNSVHFVNEDDVKAYGRHKYILQELRDIHQKKDLEDERVRVYCQPVYNIATGTYDTAEALMRLRLPETGLVFPGQFISLAEQNHYIHTLSLIILHKTCKVIQRLLEENYVVRRISVNISVPEVSDPQFCQDITNIISDTGIPFEKIAIELTESQNEQEFRAVKQKIDELRNNGIKFYLDDFGTGYSNFERIMELPFDIIKFDRSLVLASVADKKSEKMVSHLANMFDAMNYSVLYEGIETSQDEEKCVGMCARYLQGYKYSKPIPIEDLTGYFEKTA